jgi:hypothetical protein
MRREDESDPILYGYVDTVMDLWRRRYDTVQIAEALHRPESVVERYLHIGLEREYKARNTPVTL